VRRQYAVNVVGRIPEVRERFYAISVERRIRNPAVLSITSAARHELFGDDGDAPDDRASPRSLPSGVGTRRPRPAHR